MICELCQRDIPPDMVQRHHLVPKTFKGTELVNLHPICHRTIHTTFSERELKQYYHTIDRLLSVTLIQKFIKWISNKPPEYNTKTKDTNERKKRRRR